MESQFRKVKDEIQEGDLVLAWMTRTNVKPVIVKDGEQMNTRYGAFPHKNMIGKKYGTQLASSSKHGFIHLMAPTPELWTLSLPHRTQIVYTPDASYIVQRLKIRPGSRVIESGTGSGSFTHMISRTVGSKGKVFTFEFHEPRFHQAKQEIEDHGLSDTVTITHRDVCNDGFGIDSVDIKATAIFLDLPSPWAAIPHVVKVADRSRAVQVCSFSPCIEQVARTVEALKKEGFQRIEMVEVSAKKWEGRKEMVKSVNDAVERLRDVKRRRVEGLEKRNRRIDAEGQGEKRQLEESGSESATDSQQSTPAPGLPKGYNPWGKGLRIKEGDENYQWTNVSRMETEIKSHTSYLTFALLPPQMPTL